MKRLINDMINSAALYGIIAFFSVWIMIGTLWFDFADWAAPLLFGPLWLGLPLFWLLDVMVFGWRVWKGK